MLKLPIEIGPSRLSVELFRIYEPDFSESNDRPRLLALHVTGKPENNQQGEREQQSEVINNI
jgi:hypothetical protein